MATISKHSSVQPVPPGSPPAPVPPKGPCPSKHGTIVWPTIKEGLTNPTSLEAEHNLQVSKVWSPAYKAIETDLIANALKFNNMIVFIEVLEDTGNIIQKKLQDNNF